MTSIFPAQIWMTNRKKLEVKMKRTIIIVLEVTTILVWMKIREKITFNKNENEDCFKKLPSCLCRRFSRWP